MNSLESKLGQLSSDQRKEAEDFVDFLLSRSGPLPVRDVSLTAPPVLTLSPSVMTALETHHEEPGSEPVMGHDIPRTEGPQVNPVPVSGPESIAREITSDGDDWITRDYMDYGQFEHGPSPTDEAVKKVKQNLIRKSAEEKSHQLLEWID
jgi:hypothetical protein